MTDVKINDLGGGRIERAVTAEFNGKRTAKVSTSNLNCGYPYPLCDTHGAGTGESAPDCPCERLRQLGAYTEDRKS